MDCVICNNPLSSDDTVTVQKKGLETLIKFSDLRKDGLSNLFGCLNEICLHTKCRKKYTKESLKGVYKPLKFNSSDQNVAEAVAGPSGSNESQFPYKDKCFICAQELTDDFMDKENRKPIEKRCLTYRVSSEKTQQTIVAALRNNPDSFIRQKILQRIENVPLSRVQARYHKDCYSGVLLPKRNLKRGRPECYDVSTAMQIIFDYIEENEDSQFSIIELKNLLSDYIPDDRTILKRLEQKFGSRIYITNLPRGSPIVSFKDSVDSILFNDWYLQRSNNTDEERLRIVKKAAEIIREDIRTKPYDKTSYPSSNDFLKNAKEDVPQSLELFFETLAGPKPKDQSVKRKLLSIAHTIIQMLRPKKFVSCILLALSVTLKKNFGSKMLITILNSLGFCASYAETNTFEISAINFDNSDQNNSGFVQFVFDNADANINTIDGHNTFHAMGGIECRTPIPPQKHAHEIPRIDKIPNAEVLGNFGYVPLLHYNKGKNGLKEIIVKETVTDCKTIMPSTSDILWLYGKHKNIPDVCGWNGFMQNLTEKQPFEVTHIKILPFVNSPPSNYDTINTVLNLALQKTEQNNQKITIVTFDQPLYAKSREMVAAATETQTPLLKNVVVRIGGFHLLMSFMGSIGYIMAGSGLKELWSTIYAPNTVTHMLTGHAYSRALRANLMTYLVLGGLIFNEMTLNEEENTEIENILHYLNNDEERTSDCMTKEIIDVIKNSFFNSLTAIESRSPTAKLWVQYFKMVCLVKKFIEAERSGNWKLHLETVKQMLPIFIASGHFNYAKSLRLYIQDMDKLKEIMPPEEYKKFIDGAFTIRRTDKFWSGTWTDMVIEQSLMKKMKCRGGLTHGRGITDSILAKWILSMPVVQAVEGCLESFCGFDNNNDDIHKDSTPARLERDNTDVAKLTYWFEEHQPFKNESDKNIMSLSTGITGNTDTNCHQAFEVGQNILSKTIGIPFSDLTYSRKERVIPISNINAASKIQDEIDTPIDPLTIFQRISFLKKSEEEMKEYLTFELTPYPLALFDDSGMRKTKKSALYDLFTPIDMSFNGKKIHFVIDGGHLLHRVVWNKGQTYEDICMVIIEYVKKHYGNDVTTVFDGYEDNTLLTCTKTAERMRRSVKKTTADVFFEPKMQMTTSQAEFLTSNKNKSRFISLLSKYLRESGVNVIQCEADADTRIVLEALALSSSHECVCIICDDIDILVLLTGLAKNEDNVFIMKPAKGKTESKTYNSNCLKYDHFKNYILLLHAFSGCDTTSALYNYGKKKFFDVLDKNENLKEHLLVFYEKQPSEDAIISSGERFFTALYGGDLNRSLDELRYQKFAQSLTKSKINLANLPPTKSAAKQHSLRVYHQIQSWLGNPLNPTEFGWKVQNKILTPVISTMKPAPENVLKMIFCKCKKSCGPQCGCRKAGLKCSEVCQSCKGQSCTNAQNIDDDDDPYEEDDEILPEIHIYDTASREPLDMIQSKRLRI